MEIQKERVIVYPADIRRWYGISERASYRKHRQIKLELGISIKKPLTVFHLKDYLGIPLEDVEKILFM
jgi:hypothetical protein